MLVKKLGEKAREQLEIDGTPVPEYVKNMQTQLDNLEAGTKGNKQLYGIPSNVFAQEAKTALTKLKESGTKSIVHNFEAKDATIMGVGQGYNSGAGVVLEHREDGIHQQNYRRPVLLNYMYGSLTGSDTITWVEKENEDGTPLFKKELETAPLRKYKLARKTSPVRKIMVASHYSREAMDDIQGFVSELERDLSEKARDVLDRKIWGGVGDDTEILGLKNYLHIQDIEPPYNYQIENASVLDAIAVGVKQIREEHYNPSVVVVSPQTFLDMRLTKSTDGQYILPPYQSGSGASFDGIPVVVNTLLDPYELFIMDGSAATFYWRKMWTLEVSDSHGDYFLDDVLTIKLTARGALRVRDCDQKAFAYTADYRGVTDQLGCPTDPPCPTA